MINRRRMRRLQLIKKEEGVSQIVEATIVLPVVMLVVIAMFYAAVFITQRANMQVNLQNALLYYKNQESDTYVETVPVDFSYPVSANIYRDSGYLFPYRFISTDFNRNGYINMFSDFARNMFYQETGDIEVDCKIENYIVYKKIVAVAQKDMRTALNLKMVGGKNSMHLQASASVVITDGDEFIRNTDMVMDILADTEFGHKAAEVMGKISDYYNQFKSAMGVGSEDS